MLKVLGLSLIFLALVFLHLCGGPAVCVVLGGFIYSIKSGSFLICRGCSLYYEVLNSGTIPHEPRTVFPIIILVGGLFPCRGVVSSCPDLISS